MKKNAHNWFGFKTVVSLPMVLIALCGLRTPAYSAGQRSFGIDLAGSSGGSPSLTEGPHIPESHFLAGARSGFENTGSVSGFTQAGTFEQVYPGINLSVYTDEHHIEYCFLLAAGADPSLIRLGLSGVRFDSITSAGTVIYIGDGFEVYQQAPAAFRLDGGKEQQALETHAVITGGAETSIAVADASDSTTEQMNGTRLNLVPGGGGAGTPDYTFYMSKFEVTNEQILRFLNDAQLNSHNPRGENMFYDDKGNAWINPAMQPSRDELFTLDSSRVYYHPDRAPGDRYTHVLDDRGRHPYADHPVTGISWSGSVKYCNWLTLQSGRGPNELCYREGTNALDWCPATATNWDNGLFTVPEREAWLKFKGFRLPMSRLYESGSNVSENAFNEFWKAGSWNGITNVAYGFGRDTYNTNDANSIDLSMIQNTGTLPVGYFNRKNPMMRADGRGNENGFGIYDLTGNAREWLNDPARAGTPDARSLGGGSYRDRPRPLAEDIIMPPYASDDASSLRPVTTFMPEAWTQVNILFCFHTTNTLSRELLDRFGIVSPDSISGAPAPAAAAHSGAASDGDSLIPGDTTPTDDLPPVEPSGIIYKDPNPSPVEPPMLPSGSDGQGGSDGGGPPPPIPPPPPPPPPPLVLYILDVYTQNPDSGVLIPLSTADYDGQADGISAFSRRFTSGQSVTLNAPATAGTSVFQYWLRNGIVFSTSASVKVQMLSDLQMTAVYLAPVPPAQRTLIVDSSPGRNVPMIISQTDNNGRQNGSTLVTRIYDDRTSVAVTAPTVYNGDVFQGWLRNGIPFSNNRTVSVVMLADTRLTALYGQPPLAENRRLTVTSSTPDAGISVNVNIPDINGLQNGNTTFERLYEYGKPVTLTAPATASNGNTFVRWLRNGVPISNNATITFMMTTDIVLTAEYATPPADIILTVRTTNPGSGINIGIGTADLDGSGSGNAPFTRRYTAGTVTTATAPAIAPNGNLFRQWVLNGAPLSTNTTVSLTLLADAELIAAYQTPPTPATIWNLSVQSQNPDSGVGIFVSAADTNGNSSGSTAFGRSYENGTPVSLTAPATAPDGHVFSHWLVNGVRYSDSETLTMIMTSDRVVTAVYTEPVPPVRYVLTVASRNPNSAIVVSISPGDVNGQQNGSTTFTRLYDEGETVTLTARNPAFPGSSNVFRQWLYDGVPFSTNETITVTMLRDTAVTAVYGPPLPQVNHTLHVESLNPDTGVPITLSTADLNSAGSGTTAFDRLYGYGTTVTATAPGVASGGNRFQGWLLNGNLISTNPSITVSMLGDMTLTALYAPPPIERILTVRSSNPENGVPVTVSLPDNNGNQGGSTTFLRFYNDGDTVTLTAPLIAPNGRNVFQYWERDGVPASTNNTVAVALYSDTEMTAVYAAPTTFNLTIRSENPSLNVPVTVSTPDVLGRTDGNSMFVRTYNPGENTTVTAPLTSPTGSVFQQWLRNGVPFSTNPTLDITMLADLDLTAVYGPPAPVSRTLTVHSSNPDSGVLINLSPGDINAAGDGSTSFQRIYNDGETVTLTAPATAGSNSFRQWILNGSPFSTNLTETLTMLQDHEMIAVYGPPPLSTDRMLTVDSRNPDSGVPVIVSQTDNFGNANGDTTFVRIYTLGDTTTLTAPETAGTNNIATFLRWERDGVPYSENRTVSIEMLSDVRMTAVYDNSPRNVTLTVRSQNPDSGVVISVAPGDLNSETTGTTTFNRTYEVGQTVSLSAPQTADSRPFLHWLFNGAAFSTNNVINLTLLSDLTMTAVYGDPILPQPLTLTVRSQGPGGSLSTIIGATPDNNSDAGGTTTFDRIYESGSLVTLNAPATSNGETFTRWEMNGAAYSTNQTVSLTLLSDTTMTAIYGELLPPAQLTLTVLSQGPDGPLSTLIDATPDITANAAGTTAFSRIYNTSSIVTLSAPATSDGNNFNHWEIGGVLYSNSQTISLTLLADTTITAIYGEPITSTSGI